MCQFSWVCRKQTVVSHISTEAEILALDAGLRMGCSPALSLWDTIIDFSHQQAGGDFKPVH